MFASFRLSAPAVALACLLAGTAAAEDLKPFAVRLDWLPLGSHAAYHLAMDKGLYRKAGLDVKMEDGNGSVVTVQLVGAGQFDLGVASGAVMAMGRDKGLPVKSIAGFIRKSDMGIFVTAASGIKTVKDFEGRKLIYTNGSLETPFMDALFKAGGTSRERIHLVSVAAAAKLNTYLAGGGEGVITTISSFHTQIQAKLPSTEIYFSDYGLPLPGSGLFVTESTLLKKAAELRAFVKVTVETMDYVMASEAHVEEAAAAIARQRPQANVDPKLMVQLIKDYFPYYFTARTKDKPHGWQSPEDWAETIQAMEESAVLKKGTRPEDYFTNDLLPAPKS